MASILIQAEVGHQPPTYDYNYQRIFIVTICTVFKMAPKGKGGDKGKGKDAGGEKGGKVKGAQSLNVRHILCQKHAKKEEAVAKLNDGVKFDEVAREFSEDKARAGKNTIVLSGLLLVYNTEEKH